jgi:hypothetical protein
MASLWLQLLARQLSCRPAHCAVSRVARTVAKPLPGSRLDTIMRNKSALSRVAVGVGPVDVGGAMSAAGNAGLGAGAPAAKQPRLHYAAGSGPAEDAGVGLLGLPSSTSVGVSSGAAGTAAFSGVPVVGAASSSSAVTASGAPVLRKPLLSAPTLGLGGAGAGSSALFAPTPGRAPSGAPSVPMFNPLLPKTPAARKPRKGEVVMGYSANGSPLGAIRCVEPRGVPCCGCSCRCSGRVGLLPLRRMRVCVWAPCSSERTALPPHPHASALAHVLALPSHVQFAGSERGVRDLAGGSRRRCPPPRGLLPRVVRHSGQRCGGSVCCCRGSPCRGCARGGAACGHGAGDRCCDDRSAGAAAGDAEGGRASHGRTSSRGEPRQCRGCSSGRQPRCFFRDSDGRRPPWGQPQRRQALRVRVSPGSGNGNQ